MILGAQFYTLRQHTQTNEGLEECFRRVKEIGYDNVQISGIGKDITAETLAALSKKYELPIACTHTALNRIVEETEKVIAEHKLFGCTEIGLGAAPGEYRATKEDVCKLIDLLREPVRKIRRAGLTFAYHNHAFEFDTWEDGSCMYDLLIAETDWNFILDTYWVSYAGRNVTEYIRMLGSRVKNIHYKDMAEAPKGPICACGNGVLDFEAITAACLETGIESALVEQDNAPDFVNGTEDEFTQMEISARHLRPIIYR